MKNEKWKRTKRK